MGGSYLLGDAKLVAILEEQKFETSAWQLL